MNSRPKIYEPNGSCVARSYRALKRKIHNRKITGSKFYTFIGEQQIKQEFEITTVKRGTSQKRDCYRIKFIEHKF